MSEQDAVPQLESGESDAAISADVARTAKGAPAKKSPARAAQKAPAAKGQAVKVADAPEPELQVVVTSEEEPAVADEAEEPAEAEAAPEPTEAAPEPTEVAPEADQEPADEAPAAADADLEDTAQIDTVGDETAGDETVELTPVTPATPVPPPVGLSAPIVRTVQTVPTAPEVSPDLLTAVQRLHEAVTAVRLSLDAGEHVSQLRERRTALLHQLEDYLLPRLRRLDAPLLAVIGGSTGAGKSTLTNSLVGREVTRAGVLRPTTRSPVLVHHPFDSGAFLSQRILPDLARVTVDGPEPAQPQHPDAARATAVRLVPEEQMPPGLALIDAPDIDSMVEANRDLAVQLLGAADLWVFVTTASRYADAAPWKMLSQAVEQGASVAVVLDRVPAEAVQEVRLHLATMLRDRGLASAPVFTIPEVELDRGYLPKEVVAPLRTWLERLARDHSSRGVVVRRTLTGIVASLGHRVRALADGAHEQVVADSALRSELRDCFAGGRSRLEAELSQGALIRGEVLSRWVELVGTGDIFEQQDNGAGRLIDAFSGTATGDEHPIDDLAAAIRVGLTTMVQAQVARSVDATVSRWRQHQAGRGLIAANPGLDLVSGEFTTRLGRAVDLWRDRVIAVAEAEAKARHAANRSMPYGVEGTTVLLMLASLSHAAPAASRAGGDALAAARGAQRLLASCFTETEMRAAVETVYVDLAGRVLGLLDVERSRLESTLNAADVHVHDAELLRATIAAVEEAHS